MVMKISTQKQLGVILAEVNYNTILHEMLLF